VYAVAFACVVAFMGIGLVDPILPTLADQLHASPSDVSLLFTSYFAMTGVSMLVTGWLASGIGPRRTLLVGLALVVVSSALAGAAGSVFEIAGFRLGWGLGNALFIATALSVIVGAVLPAAARSSTSRATTPTPSSAPRSVCRPPRSSSAAATRRLRPFSRHGLRATSSWSSRPRACASPSPHDASRRWRTAALRGARKGECKTSSFRALACGLDVVHL
jgi:hypothetical protein